MITLYSSSAEQPVLAPLHVKSATSNELYVFCSSSLRVVPKKVKKKSSLTFDLLCCSRPAL